MELLDGPADAVDRADEGDPAGLVWLPGHDDAPEPGASAPAGLLPAPTARLWAVAVVAALLGALVPGWASSPAAPTETATEQEAGTDLRVLALTPSSPPGSKAVDAVQVMLSNRGGTPVTLVSAALGARSARAGLPLVVPASGSASLRIPLRTSCTEAVVPEGDLTLGVRGDDGAAEELVLRAGGDFLTPGPWSPEGCPPRSLRSGVVQTHLLYAQQRDDRTVQLRVMFSRRANGILVRPRLDGLRSAQPGLEVRLVDGWPVRLDERAVRYATLELIVRSCRKVHLPHSTKEPLLRLSGSVQSQRPDASAERDVEVVPLEVADISLAAVRLMARACPGTLAE